MSNTESALRKQKELHKLYELSEHLYTNRKIGVKLSVLIPWIVGALDASIIYPAFTQLVDNIIKFGNGTRLPPIMIISFMIILVELFLGQGDRNKNNFKPSYGKLFIFIIPLVTLSEGIIECASSYYSYKMEKDVTHLFFMVAIAFKFIGYALISYISHNALFKRSGEILEAYHYFLYHTKAKSINKKAILNNKYTNDEIIKEINQEPLFYSNPSIRVSKN